MPAGAVPKDGPSAGVAMTVALSSLISGRPVRNDVAMTGEVTLTGQVLPIGGLKEKSLAAQRAGIKRVIVPERNEGDVEEIPEHELGGLRVRLRRRGLQGDRRSPLLGGGLMEAATLARGGPAAASRTSLREAARSRSRAFWIVAGLTALAALLRFATLGVQSYHHDEIVTASRVLRGSFGHAMDAVGFSESAPPLYYALAWLWTQLTGTGEFGLRSLSALAGVATVPVAYLIGVELRGRRAGLVAAALVAVNPMLLWYSQEARAYALLVLLCALSLLYCAARSANDGRRRDFVFWGLASGLALATHYFASSRSSLEVVWLARRRGRASLRGDRDRRRSSGLLLAPLAIHQMSLRARRMDRQLHARAPALGNGGDLRHRRDRRHHRPARAAGPGPGAAGALPRRLALLVLARRSRRAPRRRRCRFARRPAAIGDPGRARAALPPARTSCSPAT